MPPGQLRKEGWAALTQAYPDQRVITAILGICTFGARIGYEGNRDTITIYPNLSTAMTDAQLVAADILSEVSKNRLAVYKDSQCLPSHYTASPLGLTDKADSNKRRIHNLSYPVGDPTAINAAIPEHYGMIKYSGIQDAIQAVQKYGKDRILLKRDFESAFRHIPVSLIDYPLLGFHWENYFYSECFLPFRLRNTPYLFNIFAEVFQWILEQHLITAGIPATVIHYLDDFLIVWPPEASNMVPECRNAFSTLSTQVGLSIKDSKNEEGTTVSGAGLEFDNNSMVIRLPEKKLRKARTMTHEAHKSRSLFLLDLQKLTGYLNFVSKVVPLGRTFLRRLYNLELYFRLHAARHQGRPISGEARKDISLVEKDTGNPAARSITTTRRKVISA